MYDSACSIDYSSLSSADWKPRHEEGGYRGRPIATVHLEDGKSYLCSTPYVDELERFALTFKLPEHECDRM